MCCGAGSALAGFELALRLVDHIDAALAAHDAAIAMTLLERAERVTDLHWPSPSSRRGERLIRSMTRGHGGRGSVNNGGRYKDRTCDPFDVNEVLYR